jgi:hypothetical protein
MKDSVRGIIRERIANEKPEHLNGFDEGWLEIVENDFQIEESEDKEDGPARGKSIQVFSNENGFKKIVTTVII